MLILNSFAFYTFAIHSAAFICSSNSLQQNFDICVLILVWLAGGSVKLLDNADTDTASWSTAATQPQLFG